MREFGDSGAFRAGEFIGLHARDGLDAAHAGGHAGFGRDVEGTGLTRAGQMCAAAEFAGEDTVVPSHGDHADLGAVLLGEEGHGPGLHGFIVIHYLGGNGHVGQNGGVHLTLDGSDFIGRHSLNVAEVEAEMVGIHKGAGLFDVGTEDLAQGSLKKVRGGMVAGHGHAAFPVHGESHLTVNAQGAFGDFNGMYIKCGIGFDGVCDICHIFFICHGAGIAFLAAGFSVEGSAVGHDEAFASLGEFLTGDALTVEKSDDAALAGELRVSCEDAFDAVIGELLENIRTGALAEQADLLLAFAGTGALFGHEAVKALHIDGEALLAGHVGHDVQRETVGVGEQEAEGAGNLGDVLAAAFCHLVLEETQPFVQGLREADFFLMHDAADEVSVFPEFGEVVAHDFNDLADDFVQERLVDADKRGEAQGAADEAAQDVAAAFIGRQRRKSGRRPRGCGRR